MRRRDILTALPAAAALAATPALAAVAPLPGVRIRITDVRIVLLRVVKEVGSFAGFMGPEDINVLRVGGGSFIEVRTAQQGLVGIGSGIDPAYLPMLRAELIGKDPFDLQRLVANLRGLTGLHRVTGAPPPTAPRACSAPSSKAPKSNTTTRSTTRPSGTTSKEPPINSAF